MNDYEIPEDLIARLVGARRIVAMTGAGVSAESGVPTFREAQQGLWAQYDPAELATPQAFHRNPELVWNWYCWRRDKVLSVKPNDGHYAIAELAGLVQGFSLITQNVDELHQRAGSDHVIELHGSILRAKCFDNHHFAESWPEETTQKPPLCLQCGRLMRPDVVWFNETLPEMAMQRAGEAVTECEFFFSIGTSSVVYPAAAFGQAAARSGATVVEINPQPTPLTEEATFALSGPSGKVLPAIVERLKEALAGK